MQGPHLPFGHFDAQFDSNLYYAYFNEQTVTDEFLPTGTNDLPRGDVDEVAEDMLEDYHGWVERGGPQKERVYRNEPYIDTTEDFNKALYELPTKKEIAAVRKLGHRAVEFQPYMWEDVLRMMKLFKARYGHLEVPRNYNITDELLDTTLLQDLYAHPYYRMPLGYYVEQIRCGDVDGFEDPVRRAVLDKIGFRWGDPAKYLRFRYEPMISHLLVQMMNQDWCSHCEDEDYVVEDNHLWPHWQIGMPVGRWLAIAKIQRNILLKYYPDRFELLREMKIDWELARFTKVGNDPKYWVPPP
jgi:hypothetical protein